MKKILFTLVFTLFYLPLCGFSQSDIHTPNKSEPAAFKLAKVYFLPDWSDKGMSFDGTDEKPCTEICPQKTSYDCASGQTETYTNSCGLTCSRCVECYGCEAKGYTLTNCPANASCLNDCCNNLYKLVSCDNGYVSDGSSCRKETCSDNPDICGDNQKCSNGECVDKSCDEDQSVCSSSETCVKGECVTKDCNNTSGMCTSTEKCQLQNGVYKCVCSPKCVDATGCETYGTPVANGCGGTCMVCALPPAETCQSLEYFQTINSKVYAMPTDFNELQKAVDNVPDSGLIVINDKILFSKNNSYFNPSTLTFKDQKTVSLVGPGYIDSSCPGNDGKGRGLLKSYSDEFTFTPMFNGRNLFLADLNIEFEGRTERNREISYAVMEVLKLHMQNISVDAAGYGVNSFVLVDRISIGDSSYKDMLNTVSGDIDLYIRSDNTDRIAFNVYQLDIADKSTLTLRHVNSAIRSDILDIGDGSTINFLSNSNGEPAHLIYLSVLGAVTGGNYNYGNIKINIGDKIIVNFEHGNDRLFDYAVEFNNRRVSINVDRLCFYNRNMNNGIARFFGKCNGDSAQNVGMKMVYDVMPVPCRNSYEEMEMAYPCESLWNKTGDTITGGMDPDCEICRSYTSGLIYNCGGAGNSGYLSCGENLCKSFNPTAIALCQEFHGNYATPVIELISQGKTEKEICHSLNLCAY